MAMSETANPIPLNKATARKSFEKYFVGSFLANSSHVPCSVRLAYGMGCSCGSGLPARSPALEPGAVGLGISGALLLR
jgi:hypothetical protein